MFALQTPLQRAAVAVAVVCLATAGIYVAFGGDAGTADEPIGENAAERYESIEGVSANVTIVMETPNGTDRMRLHVKQRPGTRYIYQRVYDDSGGYRETYANGSVMWQYDPQAGEATRLTLDEGSFEGENMSEQLGELFAQIDAGGDDGDDGPKRGVSPLPEPPGPVTSDPSVGNVAPPNATEYDVSYLGTETVDGRETYVVEINGTLRGRGEMLLSNVTQTLWVDSERYFPLKYHQTWDRPDGSYAVTQTYSNVTFDPGLNDSTFEFDPPENVTVNERTYPDVESYDSRAALVEAADVEVPDPDLPDGFSLQGARRIDGADESVSLTYGNGSAEVVVTVRNATYDGNGTGEEVDVNGRSGTYSEAGSMRVLTWTCDGRTVSVSGDGLARSSLVRVAESIGCASGSGTAVQRVGDEAHPEELERPDE